MEKKINNEELQSRREFFKKAAKSALPILAAVALANAPAIVNAAEKTSMGCNGTCYGSCVGTCRGGCSSSCSGSCQTTCSGGCKNYGCKGVAKN